MLSSSWVFFTLTFFTSCWTENEVNPEPPRPNSNFVTDVVLGHVQTDKTLYEIQDNLRLSNFSIENKSEEAVSIEKMEVVIKNLVTDGVLYKSLYEENIDLKVGETKQITSKSIFEIPSDFVARAYGVFINIAFQGGSSKEFYKTFFRVNSSSNPVTYEIESEDYSGLNVFKLNNGLSAEYAVQKAATNFLSGISHSWNTPLRPIASTPDFLERSLDKTVSFYNEVIGRNTPVETVIISTGIPGIPYLARSMKALVLPLHFLVGCDTFKETQTILEHANNNGYSTYGTLGYDYSVSEQTGVAWIKLLNLPEQYEQFISDHAVKNVILYGHSGVNDGETVARKITDERARYEEGSLYLMHFSGDDSETFLRQVISDFAEAPLQPSVRIADWEAGIVSEQINNLNQSLKSKTTINTVLSVTAEDGVHLWNMGTFSTLAFMKKNETQFPDSSPVKGVSLNPYLIAHPGFESYFGYVPFLYWQGFSAEFQYNNWLSTQIKAAINLYFPEVVFDDLDFWVNSTKNFGGSSQGNAMVSFLNAKGHNVRNTNFGFDEVWNLGDGINASSEARAFQLLESISEEDYRIWNEGLVPLSIEDLLEISNTFPEIIIEKI